MSEILSRMYLDSVRHLLREEREDDEVHPSIAMENALRVAGIRLVSHIEAQDDELERVKADRDALRDEVDGHKATLVKLGSAIWGLGDKFDAEWATEDRLLQGVKQGADYTAQLTNELVENRKEIERLKADRGRADESLAAQLATINALRVELGVIRPKTVTIPGPHHFQEVPLPESLDRRLDGLTKAVELVQRGQDELRQRLDSRDRNR